MNRESVPSKTIYRLSLYQRCLQTLTKNGVETVSSESLARAAGVKPTQLRKDFAHFGQLGTRGLGYKVKHLSDVIGEVLGKASLEPVILIGVGNLGSALMRYGGFQKEGFEIVAGFDSDPGQAKDRGLPLPVHPSDELVGFVREHGIKLVILAVPGNRGQEVANDLVGAGIKAILNFSPVVLQVPDEVIVHNVDLAAELERLSYLVK